VLITEPFSEAVKKYYIIDGLSTNSSLLDKYPKALVEIQYKKVGDSSDGIEK
jgi:hypothetical protein